MAISFSSCGTSSGGHNDSVSTPPKQEAWGMAFSPDYTKLAVANNLSNTVDVYDIGSMKVIKTIDVLCGPRHIAFTNKKMYVTHKNLSSDKSCATSQYDPTEPRRTNSWVSVINFDPTSTSYLKVVNEIDINASSISDAREIVYDSQMNLLYVFSATVIANTAVSIDPTTDKYKAKIYSTLSPYRIRFDDTRKIAFLFDYKYNADTKLDITRKIMVYQNGAGIATGSVYLPYGFDGQASGYCYGTSSLPNTCTCTGDGNCASGKCNLISGRCEAPATCGTTAMKTGCACTTDSACSSGLCHLGTCRTATSIDLAKIKAQCNPVDKTCTALPNSSSQKDSYLYDNTPCNNPWDMVILNNNSMFLTCRGNSTDTSKPQPILHVITDNNGLATTSNPYIYSRTQFCRQPTELAKDPNEKYVFAICFGDNNLLQIDANTGSLLKSIPIPENAIDVIASTSYVYVTSATENTLFRYPIQ